MLDQAQMLYFQGDYQACFQFCLQGLQNLESSPCEVKENLRISFVELAGLSGLKLGIKESLEFCAQSYEAHKDSFFYALNFAKALFLAEHYEQATEVLHTLIHQENPLWIECLKLLLEVYKAQNLLESADNVYQTLLSAHLKDWKMWMDFGEMYFFNHAPKKALEIYQKCHHLILQALQELENNTPTLVVEHPQHSLTARLMPIQDGHRINNPEIARLQKFLHTELEIRIAQSHLHLFESPLEEAQIALEILFHLQEWNVENAEFWIAFGQSLEYTQHYPQAEEAYKRVFAISNAPLELVSGASFALAYLLMRQDRFKEGLEYYESRLNFASEVTFSHLHYQKAMQDFLQDSKVFYGKEILVYCEQGFGDTLMFSRTLEALCKVAKKVLFAPQSALYPLFSLKLSKEKRFANLSILDRIPQEFDFALPLTSLPYFLGLDSLEKILTLQTPFVLKRKKSTNKVKRVGFYWHTDFAIKENNSRNFSLEFFLNFLLELENIKLVSLQVGDFMLPDSIENAGKDFKDWLDTYKTLENLDLVVGIDSSPAHLSLLCGIPTLIILQPRFDWRFGLYESPKAKFYGENAHLFVANVNNLNVKNEILGKIQKILES